MARCEDCIHAKVCDNLISHGLPWNDGKYPAEKWCDLFKPTADVAPRAEVEQAVAKYIVEIAETEGKKLHKKAKQEVARQIFAEIEESCSYVLQIEFGGYEHPMIKLLRNRFYDDIKRKYLEDTHET